ncbi:DNA polymerase III subunit delta [Candidatus Pelagibacter communis]|uniref:DNA polymerase III subunit delta n=1 Tax=Pelagibacter ubique TaxID=198252 RepID=UPI00094D874D|nr:DNA polymerase III subunit delta [Candidatus Pelagibacter ubique]
MIVKHFEINTKKINNNNYFLVYGDNDGLKKEIISNLKKDFNGKTEIYDENQILDSNNDFMDSVLNRSLFDKEKIFIIKRCSEKILEVIENILSKDVKDIKVILDADILEKKSKLRSYFEKEKSLVIVPTYKDTNITLIEISRKFFKEINVNISQETINLLINRCNGDRGHLRKELDKIYLYSQNRKDITIEEIYKLTNLSENYNINELVDNSLLKNLRKTSEILHESNYKSEDAILILRVFIHKAKRLLYLIEQMNTKESIDDLVNNCYPPIFWKDKPIVKKQLENWSYLKIKKLIAQINKIELRLKKNSSIGLLHVYDFIFKTSTKGTKSAF